MAPVTKEIILHIGIEKTGSTTLQSVGGVNRETLKQRGICYPIAPGAMNHTGLAIYASTGDTLKDLRLIAGLASEQAFLAFQDKFPVQLRHEIEESGCERVWLSNEHLSSRIRKPAEMLRLVHLLRSLAERIRIIIYLRDQPDLIVSQYSTSVRSGATRELRLPRSENDYFFNFALMLERWSTIWNRETIDVRIFDRASLLNGDITADFFKTIDEQLDATIRVPDGLNQSLNAHALQFLRIFNGHISRFAENGLNPEYGQIAAVLDSVSTGPNLTPPAAFMHEMAEMFATSNAFVAKRYLGRELGLLFTERTHKDGSEQQLLTLANAQSIGRAALEALDTRIQQMEMRRRRAGLQLTASPAYPDASSVLKANTVEEAVALTAALWRLRQQRMQEARAGATNSLDRKAIQAF